MKDVYGWTKERREEYEKVRPKTPRIVWAQAVLWFALVLILIGMRLAGA